MLYRLISLLACLCSTRRAPPARDTKDNGNVMKSFIAFRESPEKDQNEVVLPCHLPANRRRRALCRRMDLGSPPGALDCHQPHAATAALQCDRGTGCFGEHWTLNRLLGHGCSARVYVARGLGAHGGEAACKLAKNVGRVHWPRVVRTFAREAVRCRPFCHSRTPALATSASHPPPLVLRLSPP